MYIIERMVEINIPSSYIFYQVLHVESVTFNVFFYEITRGSNNDLTGL